MNIPPPFPSRCATQGSFFLLTGRRDRETAEGGNTRTKPADLMPTKCPHFPKFAEKL